MVIWNLEFLDCNNAENCVTNTQVDLLFSCLFKTSRAEKEILNNVDTGAILLWLGNVAP